MPRAAHDTPRNFAKAQKSPGMRAKVLNAVVFPFDVKQREFLGPGVDDGAVSGFKLTELKDFEEFDFCFHGQPQHLEIS